MRACCCACGLEHDCVPTAERDALEHAYQVEIDELLAEIHDLKNIAEAAPWFHHECDTKTCLGQCKQSYEFVEPNHIQTDKCKGWRCDGTGPAHKDAP